MNGIERYKKYEDETFDRIIGCIKAGIIKCGKYSKLVKIKKDIIEKDQKEFFDTERR